MQTGVRIVATGGFLTAAGRFLINVAPAHTTAVNRYGFGVTLVGLVVLPLALGLAATLEIAARIFGEPDRRRQVGGGLRTALPVTSPGRTVAGMNGRFDPGVVKLNSGTCAGRPKGDGAETPPGVNRKPGWAGTPLRTVVAITLAIPLLVVTSLTGCGAGDEQKQGEERAAVSRAQIDKVRKGMSESDVIHLLGKPAKIQPGDLEWERRSKWLYYNVKADDGFDQWLIAIEDGKVRSARRR